MAELEAEQDDAVTAAVARAMCREDAASRALGIEIVAVEVGRARLAMTVRADMLNSRGVCHGGIVFTLADSAFAYACNSRNQVTVASACHIDFLAPAQAGDRLLADAAERARGGRTGVYDVTVTNQHGDTVALFRGKSYRIKGEIV
jgi:acyl-CoA thioesterase